MGSICDAMRPASVMMIARTLANMGRSMKKREKFPMTIRCSARCGGRWVAFWSTRRCSRRGARRMWLNESAGPQLHQIINDHGVARFETAGDDPVAAYPVRRLHGSQRRLAVGFGFPHHASLFLFHAPPLGNQESLLLAGDNLDFGKLSRQPFERGVLKFSAELHGAQFRIHGGTGEIEPAIAGRGTTVVMEQLYLRAFLCAADALEIGLGEREPDPDRTHLGR